MDTYQQPFGVLLRRWRLRRRMTQMDLASIANSSTRHLSYLETGRAQPSREMVMRLAEDLDIPLRERNLLLLSAGFAPAFQERSLSELASVRKAIEQILEAHKPYPAFAVDRHWNIVLSNGAIPRLYVDVSPELLQPPVNAIRLTLHPSGLAPRIVNFAEWRQHVITMLRQQSEARADSGVQALLSGDYGLSDAPRQCCCRSGRRGTTLRDALANCDGRRRRFVLEHNHDIWNAHRRYRIGACFGDAFPSRCRND